MLTIVLGKTHLLSKIMLVLHHYIKHYAIVTLGLTRLVLFYNNFFFSPSYLSSLLTEEKLRNMRWVSRFNNSNYQFTLGIRLQIYGKPPTEQGLIVANHRSYFDPIVMLIHRHTFQ
jgi:1-acyl-sn-glycerol-3-phosphate acyltransferase